MIYKDLEHAEELGKTIIAVPIKDWKYCQKIREEYFQLKRQMTKAGESKVE